MLAVRLAELPKNPIRLTYRHALPGEFLAGLDAFTVFIVAKPGQMEKSFNIVWELSSS